MGVAPACPTRVAGPSFKNATLKNTEGGDGTGQELPPSSKAIAASQAASRIDEGGGGPAEGGCSKQRSVPLHQGWPEESRNPEIQKGGLSEALQGWLGWLEWLEWLAQPAESLLVWVPAADCVNVKTWDQLQRKCCSQVARYKRHAFDTCNECLQARQGPQLLLVYSCCRCTAAGVQLQLVYSCCWYTASTSTSKWP